jgi:hypothetical protein
VTAGARLLRAFWYFILQARFPNRLLAPDLAASAETATELIVDETIVIGGSSNFTDSALMKAIEVVDFAVGQIRNDQEAYLPARLAPEPIDMALEAGLHLENGLAKRFALDEVVGQLVEWSIEVGVQSHVAFMDADQDFAIELVVAIEGETGALANENAVRALRREELIGD